MEAQDRETASQGKLRRASIWSAETRRWVIIALVLVGAWLLYQLSDIVPTILAAFLLAYLLNPLVGYLHLRRGLPRGLAVTSIYLILIAVLIGGSILLTPILIRQVRGLFSELDRILAAIVPAGQVSLIDLPGFQIDSTSIADELRRELAGLASAVPRLLIGAASGILSMVLVLVMSFYLLLEADALGRSIDQLVPEEYQGEWEHIKAEFGHIWSNFLRGQVILALIIGILVTLTLAVLGVPNAFFLGLLAGLLEVVPTIGPVISMIPAVLVALFQGSTYWPIDKTVFALIVVLAYFLIQQLENHLIVPRVIGASVNLPPIVILIGAFAGANLAGVMGMFLAAPVLATGRLIGEFVLRKLLEAYPAPEASRLTAEARSFEHAPK